MAKKKQSSVPKNVGSGALVVGVFLALLFGFLPMGPKIALLLLIVGLVVGMLNVTETETKEFLYTSVALIIIMTLPKQLFEETFTAVLPWFVGILDALLIMIVPATIVVALRSLFEFARD